jgi:upstream activation factor subunit UAF30
MAFDINSLESHIRNILEAPKTNLDTISARRIRKQLIGAEPFVDGAFLKVHKKEIDLVITRVYEEVVAGRGNGDLDDKELHLDRKRVKDDGEDSYSTPTPKKIKHAKNLNLESSDAEFARRLSNELNGRSSRRSAANGSSRKVSKKRSSNFVESEDDSEGDARRKGGKGKTKSGGTARGGFAKEYTLR